MVYQQITRETIRVAHPLGNLLTQPPCSVYHLVYRMTELFNVHLCLVLITRKRTYGHCIQTLLWLTPGSWWTRFDVSLFCSCGWPQDSFKPLFLTPWYVCETNKNFHVNIWDKYSNQLNDMTLIWMKGSWTTLKKITQVMWLFPGFLKLVNFYSPKKV